MSNRLQRLTQEYKRNLLIQTLRETGVNASAAARALGVHRNHIDYLAKELDVDINLLRKTFRAALPDMKARKMKIGPSRARLPETRKSVTYKFTIGDPGNEGVRGYATVGLYDDGRPGEIFIHVDRIGSTAHGFAESWAVTASIALQYGVPLPVLIEKWKHARFEPFGITRQTEEHLKFASSIVDLVARWMEKRFLGKETNEPRNPEPQK